MRMDQACMLSLNVDWENHDLVNNSNERKTDSKIDTCMSFVEIFYVIVQTGNPNCYSYHYRSLLLVVIVIKHNLWTYEKYHLIIRVSKHSW